MSAIHRRPRRARESGAMFTGIVRAVGAVHSLRLAGGGGVLEVNLGELANAADTAPIRIGDSIAVNGACLTVAALRDGVARFDLSPETLARCVIGDWREGDALNLEPAVTLQTPLGGHLMSGHIDGAGELLDRRAADADADCALLRFAVPRALGALLAAKGAVAVDGVSLTCNQVTDHGEQTHFEVMLVPHTLAATTLGAIRPGARVHIEVDPVARYVRRALDATGGAR